MNTRQDIHVSESGQGTPVLLVHGWTCSGAVWRQTAERLAGTYRVLVPDLAGHGASAGLRNDGSMHAFAKDIETLLEHRGLEGVVLVGHSLGAAAVLEAASGAGGRVRGVVMIDGWLLDYGHLDSGCVNGLTAPFRRNLEKALIRFVRDTVEVGLSPENALALAQSMARTPAEVALAALDGLLLWDAGQALQALHCPLVWINGRRFSPRARERYGARVAGELRLDTGHFPMLEAPVVFHGALVRALEMVRVPEPGSI